LTERTSQAIIALLTGGAGRTSDVMNTMLYVVVAVPGDDPDSTVWSGAVAAASAEDALRATSAASSSAAVAAETSKSGCLLRLCRSGANCLDAA